MDENERELAKALREAGISEHLAKKIASLEIPGEHKPKFNAAVVMLDYLTSDKGFDAVREAIVELGFADTYEYAEIQDCLEDLTAMWKVVRSE